MSKSISIIKSNRSLKPFHIHQTKSQIGVNQQQHIGKKASDWYQYKCTNIVNPLPSYISTVRHSEPYRLVIDRVHNINYPKKSAHSFQYLQIMATFITRNCQVVGKTCFYQCQLPISSDAKYQHPICFYYHSKIEKNCQDVRLIIRFNLIQIKDGMVEGNVSLGIGLVKQPFGEDQVKNTGVFKECSQFQIVAGLSDKINSGSISFSYSIYSGLQLKNMIKFIPSQTIVSSQDHISGISQQFLPDQKHASIQQQDFMFVSLKQCQIHIPDKFQQQVISAIKNLNPNSNQKFQSVSSRKLIFGYHNQFQLVLPISRNLDFLGKETTGEYNINMYEALGDIQIVKVPYFYIDKAGPNLCTIAISLVYVCGSTEYEVAIFSFNPSSIPEQISVNMIAGAGLGFLGSLLPIKSTKNPTIILQYATQDNTKKQRYNEQSRKNQLKASKSPRNIKQSQKILEQLEKQRIQLQKQKEQLQILKTQKNMNYQQNFQKRLQEERQILRKKQQMIENQYREQVQRQIKAKIQLQNEIRAMKQRLTEIQQGQKSHVGSNKISYNQSPAEFDPSILGQQIVSNFPFNKQKVNANYLIQQEKTIPLNEVRQIMAKNFQVSTQIVDKQLKQFNFASKFSLTFNSVIWSSQVSPPKSFYMVIKFFNFKEFITDPITYIQSGFQHHQLIRLHHFTYNLQNTTPTYQFLVDPSQFANPEILQEDLVNFLSKYHVIIDLFDADNYLYIGQINIKMNQLFRGSKSQVMIAKQYNIIKLKGQENYGVIQILIKNQIADCKDQIELRQKKLKKQVRKKVISNNPILISKQIHQRQKNLSQIGAKNQLLNRQQKRIELYKKRVSQAKKGKQFDNLTNNEKGIVIQKINQYKQKKMPQLIKKIYQDLLTQNITINPYFGQAKTFIYQFTNMSQSPSSYRVSFQGDKAQLSLIKDLTEWKYFVSKNRYPAPRIYQCINDENSFYLSPGQTIPLLFRYLSFDKQNSSNLITVTVTKQQNNWIAGGFALNIEPHQSIVNHSYVLYQPGHQIVDLIIPVVYSSNDVRTPKKLFLTIEEATAQWISQYEIMLRVKAPQIMTKLKFNLLLYEDSYFYRLKENWLIQLYAYEGVYAVSKSQQKTKFKISVPSQIIQQLKPYRIDFFSSHPDLVFQEQSIDGIKLAKGSAEVWCQIFPGRITTGSVQITCINEKKQLLYGWIVQVYPYSPKII